GVGGLPEVGPRRERLGFRGGHEFAAGHADGAGGGDFFGARVVGVDLVGDRAARGGGVGAAHGRAVGDRGAFFDGDRGARFAFAGERGGGRGGQWTCLAGVRDRADDVGAFGHGHVQRAGVRAAGQDLAGAVVGPALDRGGVVGERAGGARRLADAVGGRADGLLGGGVAV